MIDKNFKKDKRPEKLIKKVIFAVFAIFIFIAIFSLIPIPGNFKIFTVQSGSMSPAIRAGNAVIVKPANEYGIDDIITFNNTDNQKETTTHRIIDIRQINNDKMYITKGDANDGSDSNPVYKENIIGKVMISIPVLGYPINFARTLPGIIILIIIPSTIIIYEEIKKITKQLKKLKLRKMEKDILAAENPQAESELPQLSKKEKIFNSFTKHRKLFLFVVTATSFLLFSNSALAVTKTSGDLTITYPDEPLFNETNIAPGYLTSKIITVTNNAGEEKTVGIEFTGTSTHELDEMLYFTIEEGGSIIYGGSADPKTLADLLSLGEISLTNISPNSTTTMTISANLNTLADNPYQLKASIFDIRVGFIYFEPNTFTIPETNTNTPKVLGEEIIIDNPEPAPQENIKILGVELPITGDQLLSYSLLLISITIISAFSITKLLQKRNSRLKK